MACKPAVQWNYRLAVQSNSENVIGKKHIPEGMIDESMTDKNAIAKVVVGESIIRESVIAEGMIGESMIRESVIAEGVIGETVVDEGYWQKRLLWACIRQNCLQRNYLSPCHIHIIAKINLKIID